MHGEKADTGSGRSTGVARSLRGVRGEDGNTLLLFPAALLVVLALAALALDAATIYLGQRRLADLAAAAANDAIASLDLDAYYRDAAVDIDPEGAGNRLRAQRLQLGEDRGFEDVVCHVDAMGDVAAVHCEARVRPILAPLWASSDRVTVRARETARAAER